MSTVVRPLPDRGASGRPNTGLDEAVRPGGRLACVDDGADVVPAMVRAAESERLRLG
jgi:hypothetical protein